MGAYQSSELSHFRQTAASVGLRSLISDCCEGSGGREVAHSFKMLRTRSGVELALGVGGGCFSIILLSKNWVPFELLLFLTRGTPAEVPVGQVS